MLESAHENLANKANSIMSKKKFNSQLLFFEQFLAGNSGHFIDVRLKQLYEQQALSCQCVWCSRVHPSCQALSCQCVWCSRLHPSCQTLSCQCIWCSRLHPSCQTLSCQCIWCSRVHPSCQALSCQCVWCSRLHPSCCRGELLLSRPCPASVSGVLEFTLHVVEGNCYSAGPVLPVYLVF